MTNHFCWLQWKENFADCSEKRTLPSLDMKRVQLHGRPWHSLQTIVSSSKKKRPQFLGKNVDLHFVQCGNSLPSRDEMIAGSMIHLRQRGSNRKECAIVCALQARVQLLWLASRTHDDQHESKDFLTQMQVCMQLFCSCWNAWASFCLELCTN